MNKQMYSDLRTLIDARRAVQKTHLQYNGRLTAIDSGRANTMKSTYDLFQRTSDMFSDIEDEHNNRIVEFASDIEIIQRAVNVKGVGFLSIAKIVACIDIEIADTVSSLWRYAGYAVDDDGKAQRRKKGQKSDFNGDLRTSCYNLGVGLLRANSPYRSIYDEAKEEYLNRDWTKMHAHLGGIRKMMKIFLQHLWITWRQIEGLPVTEPYAFGIENHSITHYLKPEDFGWKT